MAPPTREQFKLTRAKAVVSSLRGISALKILLALAATSRPRARRVSHAILRILSPGKHIKYSYKVAGHRLSGFLRWKDIDSDLQSTLELAVGDCYRLNSLPKPDVIIDGGANTGLFSLAAAARWPDSRIIAFEPSPSNIDAIKAHLKENRLQSRVRLEQVALSGAKETKRFFIREANQGSLTADLPADESIDVDCRQLAEYLPKEADTLKLIKLDIEGGEVDALNALFEVGGTPRTIIVMELHNTPITRPWIEELAERINYSIEFYEVGSVTAHCQLNSPDLHD